MTQYHMTDAEMTLLLNDSRIYADLPVDLSWIPTRQIPDARIVKDYEVVRIRPPAGSQWGEHSWGVATARTETERQLISLRYTWEFNKTHLRIAKRNNYALLKDNLAVGAKTMNVKLAQLWLQGSTDSTDRVPVAGMLDVGEAIAGAADAWNTATNPVAFIGEGFSALIANDYAPPYTLIASWNLAVGMGTLNAAAGQTHKAIIVDAYNIERIIYAHNGDDTAQHIYPLPAAVDDGVFIMCQVSPENFYMAQASQGIEISPLVFNPANNNFVVHMEWRGVPVFRGADGTADSAGYIVHEDNVDFD